MSLAADPANDLTRRSSNDLKRARSSQDTSSGGSGRIYTRGYYRKNGGSNPVAPIRQPVTAQVSGLL